MTYIVLGEPVSLEHDASLVGGGDVVDDAYEGGLSCSVRSEKPVDFPFGDTDAHIIKREMGRV